MGAALQRLRDVKQQDASPQRTSEFGSAVSDLDVTSANCTPVSLCPVLRTTLATSRSVRWSVNGQ